MSVDSNDEELFSMDELEKDLRAARGGRRLRWFLGGLVVGVAAALLLPRFLGPYLPDAWRGNEVTLSGPVLGEERDGDRLLLTLDTESGALIASFSERVAEIALLVERGDVVSIAAPGYDPFIENPEFVSVRKAGGESRALRGEGEPTADSVRAPDSIPEADTVPAASEGAGGVDSPPATAEDSSAAGSLPAG